MINKGRYNHLHLYEVTEQDLLIPTEIAAQYKVGNVLVFADKKTVDLGCELARADDITAAREYLANSETLMYERLQELQAQNTDLSTRIRQRDELLHDLNNDLRHERDMAAILKIQLNEAYCQLEIEALSRSELVDDLQQVSVDTHTVEIALEKTLAEKVELEQELAARIVDLVELNFQNDDLKRQLEKQPTFTNGTVAAKDSFATKDSCAAKDSSAIHESLAIHELSIQHGKQSALVSKNKPKNARGTATNKTNKTNRANKTNVADTANNADRADNKETAQVLTVSSGKQVHIYHEFSAPPRRTARTAVSLAVRTIARAIGILLIVAILFAGFSVAATAYSNNVSPGEALDILLKML